MNFHDFQISFENPRKWPLNNPNLSIRTDQKSVLAPRYSLFLFLKPYSLQEILHQTIPNKLEKLDELIETNAMLQVGYCDEARQFSVGKKLVNLITFYDY